MIDTGYKSDRNGTLTPVRCKLELALSCVIGFTAVTRTEVTVRLARNRESSFRNFSKRRD